MKQSYENLSAFMDGESQSGNIVDELKSDAELQAAWRRYHVIRSAMRKETGGVPEFDISASVAAALEHEPTVMAPKSKISSLPIVRNVIPFTKQIGQFAVAASVAAVAILGVQQLNQPTPSEPFSTFTTPGPLGGLSPVSLEQTRALPRDDMEQMLDKKRKINALIADHQQQIRLKQTEQQSEATDNTTAQEPNSN